jgi:hypothetical protein
MTSVPRFPRSLFLLIAGLLACSSFATAGWETIRHDGRDYVTARSIKTFYGFTSMKRSGSFLELENAAVKMRLTVGGQEAFMNNVKFVFSFKILAHQGRYLISASWSIPSFAPPTSPRPPHSPPSSSTPATGERIPEPSIATAWRRITTWRSPACASVNSRPAVSRSS